jgi:hypothetical protein
MLEVEQSIKVEFGDVVGLRVAFPAAFRNYGLTGSDMLLWAILTSPTYPPSDPHRKPMLSVTMPCGERVTYQYAADLPEETVMCPCGDPTHYSISLEWVED